jgi:hypothetical protein
MPEFSDALSSISNAPSELMSEIPEEILEVESVVSADFGTTASKHAVPPVQWFCMSGTPSEISEDIEAEEESDRQDDLYSDHAVFGEVETALSSDDSSQQSNHTSFCRIREWKTRWKPLKFCCIACKILNPDAVNWSNDVRILAKK